MMSSWNYDNLVLYHSCGISLDTKSCVQTLAHGWVFNFDCICGANSFLEATREAACIIALVAVTAYLLCVGSFENRAHHINTLRSKQNGRRFPDNLFKWIFLNENVLISIDISLKFVPNGPINNIPALVQIMAWRRSGDKPLSEPMMVSSLTHICVTRPQ